MKGTAYLMVRAELSPRADRAAFDRWYADEHLPDAVKAFGANKGWRGWSAAEPQVHYAFYEFDDLDRLRAIQDSPELKSLIAEFDRAWGTSVTRMRAMIEVVQALPG